MVKPLSWHGRRPLSPLVWFHPTQSNFSSWAQSQLWGRRTKFDTRTHHEIGTQPETFKSWLFPLASISIGWGDITHATLNKMSTEEGDDFLQWAPSLEYYCVSINHLDHPRNWLATHIIHPWLHSFHLSTTYPYHAETFLEATTLPSLDEWTQHTIGPPIPVTTMLSMLSLLECSRCCLKFLNLIAIPSCPLAGLDTLLQATSSLECLQLFFNSDPDNVVMHDLLIRIFSSAPGRSNISVEDPIFESFLPCLQYFECFMNPMKMNLSSWGRISQLYCQGRRQSLTLKFMASQ